jgi:hypothetical protein
LAVRLHGDMSVEMIQGAIGLFTTIPATLIHALDLFISSTGTLVLLSTWDRDEGVNLRQRMLLTISGSPKLKKSFQVGQLHWKLLSGIRDIADLQEPLKGNQLLQIAVGRHRACQLLHGLATEVGLDRKVRLLDRDAPQLGLQRLVFGRL